MTFYENSAPGYRVNVPGIVTGWFGVATLAATSAIGWYVIALSAAPRSNLMSVVALVASGTFPLVVWAAGTAVVLSRTRGERVGRCLTVGRSWRHSQVVAGFVVGLLTLSPIQVLLGSTSVQPPDPTTRRLLAAFLVAAPIQVLAEEVFFRSVLPRFLTGIVPRRLGTSGRFSVAAGLSIVIFAAVHAPETIHRWVELLALGLATVSLTATRGGIETAVGLHLAMNIVAFLGQMFGGASVIIVTSGLATASTVAALVLATGLLIPGTLDHQTPRRRRAPATTSVTVKSGVNGEDAELVTSAGSDLSLIVD